MTLDEAIKNAIENVRDPIGAAYLKAIPRAIDEYGTDGLKTQILYSLANMSQWHGPLARESKEVMKKFAIGTREHAYRGVR